MNVIIKYECLFVTSQGQFDTILSRIGPINRLKGLWARPCTIIGV